MALKGITTEQTVKFVEKEKKSRTTTFQKVVYDGKEYDGWVVRINGVVKHEYVIDPNWLPHSADEICPEYIKAYCKNKGVEGLEIYKTWVSPQLKETYEKGHAGDKDYSKGQHYISLSQTQIKKAFIEMLTTDHPELKGNFARKIARRESNLEWVLKELKEAKKAEKKTK